MDTGAPPDAEPPPPPEVKKGYVGVRGRVVDADTGEPVVGVLVEVDGTDVSSTTDRAGEYALELPPGTYTLRLYGDLYQRHRIRGVVVRRGVTSVDVRLSAEAIEEVVVLAPPDTASDAVQVVRRRKRATVSDAISAEQISRSPDSNASDAAKRMVGATVQDNRYVVIRGLGGRYSLTLLNGVPLPSPDPDVPAAPLDLFPAALLANLTVTKTFSPDMPGNFAGGALSIETRSFPSKFTLKLKAGMAAESETTFNNLNAYQGGRYDALGYDDGTRDLPSLIPSDKLAADPSLTQDQFTGQMLAFSDVWTVDQSKVGPAASFGVTVGDTIEKRGQRLGYFASAGYGHSYNRRLTHVAKVGEPDGEGGYLPSVLQLDQEQGTASASLNGLLTAGWSPSSAHTLNLITLYTHSGEDSGSLVRGVENSTAHSERTRLRFLERQMFFTQLVGDDGLLDGKAILGWQVNVARVSQHEPDTRDLLRTQIPDGRYVIDRGSGSADRLFSDLGDTSGGGGADVTVPFEGVKLKVGGSYLRSARDYQARRFHFLVNGDDVYNPPEEAFSDANADSLSFYEVTLPSDGYAATRGITSAFAMADLSLWEPLRIVGGARFEQSTLDLGLESKIDLGAPPMTLSQRTDRDVLPALNVVYGLTGTTNLRAAYGMTVARPNFREVAPSLFYDYVRRRAIGGNPDLIETRIHNADVRWETFLGDTELVAASLFYKKFLDPIEQTVEDAGDGQNVGFANAAGATSYGLELEARLSLARVAPALQELSVSANLALIGSKIDLMGVSRPLQGQSPYVANIDLGWERAALGTQVDLLYNAFGRRIEEVGTGGSGNVYEEPFHRLDLSLGQKLPRGLKLKLAATNLLHQRVVRTQNDVEIFAYQVGTSFVASLEYSAE
ncbi:MAG: TonB-dependent receptor [Kofleriaceae bacterium]|nr:TonB-dependent receptor [Kofleriaceae bacterium]